MFSKMGLMYLQTISIHVSLRSPCRLTLPILSGTIGLFSIKGQASLGQFPPGQLNPTLDNSPPLTLTLTQI